MTLQINKQMNFAPHSRHSRLDESLWKKNCPSEGSSVNELQWWHGGVIYQIYPRSFRDSNGDGIGDLRGIRDKLDYLQDLGIDAIWLSPFFKSPMKDFGYDIQDYCEVDTIFGSLADFDDLIAEAHRRKIKVLIDLVPNHTSDKHEWFIESRSSLSNPKRDWYIWSDGKGGTDSPPNNWQSFFGGPAWTLEPVTNQFYLHQFLPEQPELNYRNPEVVEAMLDVMRFWLKRNIDGFRVDVMWLLLKDELLRDEPDNPAWRPGMWDRQRHIHIYTEDLSENHELISRMRRTLDEFSSEGNEKLMVGEIYLPYERLAKYFGSKEQPECHLPFNFGLITQALPDWRPQSLRREVEAYEASLPEGAHPNYVLGNHDRSRIASIVGARQVKNALMFLLTMRGTITIYYGDELGMQNGVIPENLRQDPAGSRQPSHPELDRDPARTPMQWNESVNAGFSENAPWLPLSADYASVNVEMQKYNPCSPLLLTKRLLALRKVCPAIAHGTTVFLEASDKLLRYERRLGDTTLEVALNFGEEAIFVPTEGEMLVSTHGFPAKGVLRGNEGIICMKCSHLKTSSGC